jgi:hypothetical protein
MQTSLVYSLSHGFSSQALLLDAGYIKIPQLSSKPRQVICLRVWILLGSFAPANIGTTGIEHFFKSLWFAQAVGPGK